jgi:hypothetical protein
MRLMKGFTVSDIAPLALAVMIAAIVVSLGGSLLQDQASTQCTQAGYTYGNYVRNGTVGCCSAVSNGNCSAFYYGSYAINATNNGLTSMQTFGNWLPTIALVTVFSIIIGVIVVYLGRGGGRGGY